MPRTFEGKHQMSFTKTLLAGAALTALTAATASAGAMPSIHLAGNGHAKAIHLKSTSMGHQKTHIPQQGKGPSYTVTFTFPGSFSASTALGNPILLPHYAWYSPSTCTEPSPQKMKYTKDSHAKIKKSSSTGSISGCTGTTFTFYGGSYTLKDKNATSDNFTGTLSVKAKNNSTGYNLKLIENFEFTFS
jgi:hypothetical protein